MIIRSKKLVVKDIFKNSDYFAEAVVFSWQHRRDFDLPELQFRDIFEVQDYALSKYRVTDNPEVDEWLRPSLFAEFGGDCDAISVFILSWLFYIGYNPYRMAFRQVFYSGQSQIGHLSLIVEYPELQLEVITQPYLQHFSSIDKIAGSFNYLISDVINSIQLEV